MNTEVMFSSKSDTWETPQDLFDSLDSIYKFETDVCATFENRKCENYYSPEMNGLSQSWNGSCWMNPPYGREIGKWIKKAFEESEHCLVVALLPARTDTKWFHKYIYNQQGVSVVFLKGRLRFKGAEASAPFPSMIVTFNRKYENNP